MKIRRYIVIFGIFLTIVITGITSHLTSFELSPKVEVPNVAANAPFQSYCGVDTRGSNDHFHWGVERVLSEPVYGMDLNEKNSHEPAIAIENGKIYAVWADSNNTNGAGTGSDIFFRCYDGFGWSEMFVVSEPVVGIDNSVSGSYDPELAVVNGEVHVVWQENTNFYNSGGDPDIFYRHFDGVAWDELEVVSEPNKGFDLNTGNSYNPAVAVRNSTVYAVWTDPTFLNGAGSDTDIFYRVREGDSWSNIHIVSEPIQGADINKVGSYQPRIDVDDNRVHVVWSDANETNGASTDTDIFYRYHDGSSWSQTAVVSEPVAGNDLNDGPSQWPDIAVDNSGVYFVWEDHSNIYFAEAMEIEICYRHLSDSGWSGIEVISEPVASVNNNIEQSYHSKIDVEDGKVYIVWEDKNNTYGASPDAMFPDEDIFYRWFDGVKWSKIKILSEPIFGNDVNKNPSRDPAIVVEHNKVHVVWDDKNLSANSGSDRDIFYRTTYVAPEFLPSNVTPTSGFTNTVFTYVINYSDADNEPPSYVKLNLDGTNFTMQEQNASDNYHYDGKLYFYSTTLNISTDHDYRFFATDGIYEIGTALFEGPQVMNTRPNITTQNSNATFEDELYNVQYNFTDIDHWQAHAWQFQTNATSWLSFNPSIGALNGIPINDDVGRYWLNISITDELGGFNYTNFTLTVININDAPELVTIDNTTAYEDEIYNVQYEVIDVDPGLTNLTWSFDTSAGWLRFNTTNAILNGTPTNEDVGKFWVNISVEDSVALDHTNFTISVINTNDPPTIITEDLTVTNSLEFYAVHYEAADIDPSPQHLTWYLATSAEGWLTMNTTTGWLNGTPDESHSGEFWVNVSVYDIGNGSDFHNFTLKVYPPFNEPPIINTSALTDRTAIGQHYSFQFKGTDDRTIAENLTWTLVTNATWLAINSSYGILNGTPSEGDGGWVWVNISLDDGEGGISFFNFTINITKYPAPSNTKPELILPGIAPVSGDTETEFTFSVQYIDADGDRPQKIVVVIDNISYDMEFVIGDPASGKYEYTTQLSIGNHTYYFTVSDGQYTIRTENLTISNITLALRAGVEDSSTETGVFIVISIVIIIIIILIVFLILRKRKHSQDSEKDLAEGDETAEDESEPEDIADEDVNIESRIESEDSPPSKSVKLPFKPPKAKKPAIIAPKRKTRLKGVPKRPVLQQLDESATCNVCLGVIKTSLPVIKCTCGKTYHQSCADRIINCPNCDTNLLYPESKLKDDDEVSWD